jgi:hypothetical protein
LAWLSGKNEYIEILEELYELLAKAVKEMDIPAKSTVDFINRQIKHVLEQFEHWKSGMEKH